MVLQTAVLPEPHRILRRGGCGLVDLLGAQALQLLDGLCAASLHHELVVHVVQEVGLLLAGLVQLDHGMAHRWPYLPFLRDHSIGFLEFQEATLDLHDAPLFWSGLAKGHQELFHQFLSGGTRHGYGSRTCWESRLACAGELQVEVVLVLYSDCYLRVFRHVHGNPGKVFPLRSQ